MSILLTAVTTLILAVGVFWYGGFLDLPDEWNWAIEDFLVELEQEIRQFW